MSLLRIGSRPIHPGEPDAASRAVSLRQLRLGLGLAAHLYDKVDLGGRGAYYLFGSSVDPALLNRALVVAVNGPPLAPLSWEAGPTAAVSFTRKARLSLSGTYARYADPCSGSTSMATATFAGRPGFFRLWAGTTLQVDRPPRDKKTVDACAGRETLAPSPIVYVSGGVGYTF